MSEGRRLVAFDKKVTGPGKAVANGNPEQSPDVVATSDSPHEYGQSKQSAAGMEKTIPRARMFFQVERKELFVGGELVLVRVSHGLTGLRLRGANLQ